MEIGRLSPLHNVEFLLILIPTLKMNFGAFSKVTQTLNKGLNDVKQFATEKLVQIDPGAFLERRSFAFKH